MRSKSEVHEIVKRAEKYCLEQGLRLTAGRRSILERVVSSRRPVKAYDLITAASGGQKPMPPLVYRALDFWTTHKFIHRIESLNAYTACTHPGCRHECHIFVCSKCGRVSEICDASLEKQVYRNALAQGFVLEQLRIETSGRCPDCTS
jgi:Fur family zinc uptake transcriptional regulator